MVLSFLISGNLRSQRDLPQVRRQLRQRQLSTRPLPRVEPVGQDDETIRHSPDVIDAVGDEHHGLPLFPHPADELQHLVHLAQGQGRRWFVQDDELGIEIHGLSDGQPLPGVIEIEVGSKSEGIFGSTANLISKKGISIRQAYAEDTELQETPILTIITEEPVGGEIISEFLKIKGVTRVSIY